MCDELKTFIYGLGASFAGFSKINDKLPDPLKKYPYAVTLGIRLSDAIIDEIENEPTFSYFNHYRSVNALIDQMNLKVLLYIQDKGYKAYSIAASQSVPNAPLAYSGVFPHKTAAVAAGLGWIGKNGLFIHETYGPRVRLGTVLTDMELPYTNEIKACKCDSCNKCTNACPALALKGRAWSEEISRSEIVDARACSEYMNKKFKHIGRGSVCGICIRVCNGYNNSKAK